MAAALSRHLELCNLPRRVRRQRRQRRPPDLQCGFKYQGRQEDRVYALRGQQNTGGDGWCLCQQNPRQPNLRCKAIASVARSSPQPKQ